MVTYTVTWRKGRDASLSAHGWNPKGESPRYHVKEYATKKDIFNDVEIAWSKGWFPEIIEVGTLVDNTNSWVNGPKYIGTVYKYLKDALDNIQCRHNALPQPFKDGIF